MASTLSVTDEIPRAPAAVAPGPVKLPTTSRRTSPRTGRTSTRAALRAQIDEARARVAEVPAEVVVINHAMGLYEYAAIHLSAAPPDLTAAALAIDAFACLVEGLGDRLGTDVATLATPWPRSAWPSSRSSKTRKAPRHRPSSVPGPSALRPAIQRTAQPRRRLRVAGFGDGAGRWSMDAPILFVVDENPEVLEALSGDLGRRFAADYRILSEPSPASALTVLERLAAASRQVALVVAGQQMIGTSGWSSWRPPTGCTRRPNGSCGWSGATTRRPTRRCGP